MTATSHDRPTRTQDRPRRRGPVVDVVALVGIGVVAGALTSLGQGHLPEQLSSLANAATPWTVVAYLCALLPRRLWASVAFAFLGFVLLLVGYEIASTLRVDVGMSSLTWTFWLGVGLVVALPLGYAAWAVHARPRLGMLLSVGLLSGLAVGEGVMGLTVVAATTSPVYWSLSIAAGVLGLTWYGLRTRSVRSLGTAVLLAVACGGVFLLLQAGSGRVWFFLSDHLL
ncbi:MAG: DUF6518 family protein [Nocardioidaceae bacterium]|nr:DUF6518 family protein [Nocardioidaceae bacterium]